MCINQLIVISKIINTMIKTGVVMDSCQKSRKYIHLLPMFPKNYKRIFYKANEQKQ